MGWGFRKSAKLTRGVRLNVGKKTAGIIVGPRGAGLSVNTRGRRSATLSLLGFFWRKRL
jgi:hypothetical protein